MIRQIKAELQKLWTIRSTYVILGLCLLATIFFAFYIEGLKQTAAVTDSGKLASEVTGALQVLPTFITLAGLLLVTHEYRYNTIMYTLTATNSRLKILFAKVIAVSCFAVLAAAVFGTLSPLLTDAALHIKGLTMVPQSIPVLDLLWRGLFFGWAHAMYGVIIAFIIRSQVGAIVTYLVFPGIVESLLQLLLKANAVYLPFTALGFVVSGPEPAGKPGITAALSHDKAALTVLIYVAVGLVVSAILFQRRDAN